MDLVDRHRGGRERRLASGGASTRRRPTSSRGPRRPSPCGAAASWRNAVRVGLVDPVAPRRGRRCGTCRRPPGPRPGRSLPRPPTPRSARGGGALGVPAVEVADDRDRRGVGGPHAEGRSDVAAGDVAGARRASRRAGRGSLVEEEEVVGRQQRLAVANRPRPGLRRGDFLPRQERPSVAEGSLPSRPRQSARRAASGSTRIARRAGSHAASVPAAARTAAAPASVARSPRPGWAAVGTPGGFVA